MRTVHEILFTRPTTLDALLCVLTSGYCDDLDWSDLPTYGGAEPADTLGVWSWDPERQIVGSCADDLRIVPR